MVGGGCQIVSPPFQKILHVAIKGVQCVHERWSCAARWAAFWPGFLLGFKTLCPSEP